ncbi:MAG: peptidylprolyl isomerase [Acidimicrobiia bacterium]|nr:peptidylprolyl isomerase [Acidimicrobiia bacterium]
MPLSRPKILLIYLAASLSLTACAGDTADAGASVSTPEYLAFREQPTACGAERPDPAVAMQFTEPADMGSTEAVDVVLETSCGDISLVLYPEIAPVTVNSFVFLAEQGYYDGIALHRLVPGYIVQIGDPTATGGGSPGYRLPDELPPAGFLSRRGVVAMANRGANTGGSQFFLMIEDAPLPAAYSVFGEVTSGFDVIAAMAAVPMGPNPGDTSPSRPLETIYIDHIEVIGG